MRRFILTSLLVWVLPVQADLQWIKFDPFVIRTNRVTPVAFSASITPSAVTGRIDLFAGGTVPLTTSDGGATWTGSLTPAQLLAGYAADDVNRNVFGKLRLLDANGNDIDGQSNLAIGVLDAAADTAPVTLTSNLRINNNVVAMVKSSLADPTGTAAVQNITQTFYGKLGDNYDFLNIVYALPEYPENRDHFATRNDMQGIGKAITNNDALFGSAGYLKGITRYPLAHYFDMGEPSSLHEIGHQWINFLNPAIVAGGPHWPPSQMAHHLMGVSIPGSGAGGQYSWKYVQQANGSYVFEGEPWRDDFNDIDLYLMGFLDANAVVPQLVLSNPTQLHCQGCPTGPVTSFGASQIIAQHGPRVPSAATSQKSFRVATIVVSRDRQLTHDEMQFFALFASRASATQPQQWSIGMAKGTSKPFVQATRGVATLASSLISNNVYPRMSNIVPRFGPAGTSVQIQGTGFSSPTVVVCGQIVTPTSQSSTVINVIVPAGAAGACEVAVRQSSGYATWPVGFTRQ